MKHLKIWFVVLMTMLLVFSIAPFVLHAAAADSGTCGNNITWTLDDHGTLTISGTGEMEDSFPWAKYKETIQRVVIEEGVTTIAALAFSHYPSLSEVDIPASVTEIGHPFSGCTSLTEIHVAEGNASLMSDENGCIYNKEQTVLIQYPCGRKDGTYLIPDGVTTISQFAFYDCPTIQTVTFPDSLTIIEPSAFYHCVSLAEVFIPAGLTSIGPNAFAICGNCKSFTVSPENPAFSSDTTGCLYNHDKTILIQYPCGRTEGSFTIPSSVIRVGRLALSGCKTICSITIPKSVVSIGWSAFSNTDNLKDVYYEGKQSGNNKMGETWEDVSIEGDNHLLELAQKHWETTIKPAPEETVSAEPSLSDEPSAQSNSSGGNHLLLFVICAGELVVILILAVILLIKKKPYTH